jgi:hypothetical protein
MQRKKWYSPGWICVCLFPPLLIYKAELFYRGSFQHTISFRTIPFKWQRDFIFWEVPKPPETWYEIIKIAGDKNQNRKSLRDVASRLHEIRSREEKGNGILFRYTNDADYESFVETLNMLELMDWKSYAAAGNEIWAVYRPSRSELINRSRAVPTIQSVLKELPQPGRFKTVWAVIGEKIIKGWKKKWPALLCFAILASFAKWYSGKLRTQRFKENAQTFLR